MLSRDEMNVTLNDLVHTYGVYEVVRALVNAANKSAEKMAENAEAVVHRDLITLVKCAREMKNNHPFLRQLD